MSGLTVGYLSCDEDNLGLKMRVGNDLEKKRSAKILPLIKQHHWLLVTMLLMNAAAMEALPIFLDRLVPEWASILISVTAVLIFGEIIPQALCTGPNKIAICSFFVYPMRFLMYGLCIIGWPLAKLLDKVIGHEEPE